MEKPKREEKPYPPPDRPVYTVRPSEEREIDSKGIRLKGLLVVLFGVAAVAGILFAASYFNVPISVREPAVKGASAVAVGGSERSALKVEVTRTLQILEEMAAEFKDEPEKLEKIEKLKKETREILDLLGSKTP